MKSNLLKVPKHDQWVIELIAPDLSNGPWIAGGSVIRWYQGLPVELHDIDVFFRNRKQFDDLKNQLVGRSNNLLSKLSFGALTTYSNWQLIYSSESAETYKTINNEFLVQLIQSKFYTSIDEVLNGFDITASKIATDGKYWYSNHPLTEQHIQNRVLDMDTIQHKSAIKRLLKYWAYGYQPTARTLNLIESQNQLNTDFANDIEYDV